jgi:hypothetical protein
MFHAYEFHPFGISTKYRQGLFNQIIGGFTKGKYFLKIIFIFVLSFCLLGCASQRHASNGWSYLDENNPHAAITEFNLSLENETLPGSFLGLYKSYERVGDTTSAIKYLLDGLARFPENRHINYATGEYYFYTANNPELGIFYLRKAQKLFGPGRISSDIENEIQQIINLKK